MGRAPCCDKNGLKKGPWTAEEDQKLIDYVQKHGDGSWRTLPKNAGLARCGKSCRLRWTNYLRPDIKRGRFSFEEEETIIQLHSILGNKWSAIAARLPGRTDNEIKNYWNTHIRKRLLRMGIDPVTHSPRLDLSVFLANPSLYNNAAPFDISRLLGGVESFVNYSELVNIATNLLSNQIQDPFQSIQGPSSTTNTAHSVDVGPFQPGLDHHQMNSWDDDISIQAKFLENLVPSKTVGNYDNLEQSVENFVSDDSKFYLPNIPNYSLTPVSSPTQLNSSSTNFLSSRTEDEMESYCSELLSFQVPDLLDVSEFM